MQQQTCSYSRHPCQAGRSLAKRDDATRRTWGGNGRCRTESSSGPDPSPDESTNASVSDSWSTADVDGYERSQSPGCTAAATATTTTGYAATTTAAAAAAAATTTTGATDGWQHFITG